MLCRFRELPSVCLQPALRELDLSNNAIESLPAGIGAMTSLRILNIASNTLQGLPAEMSKCTALVGVDASCNKITRLPAQLKNLQLLRDFQLGNNM